METKERQDLFFSSFFFIRQPLSRLFFKGSLASFLVHSRAFFQQKAQSEKGEKLCFLSLARSAFPLLKYLSLSPLSSLAAFPSLFYSKQNEIIHAFSITLSLKRDTVKRRGKKAQVLVLDIKVFFILSYFEVFSLPFKKK